MFCLADEQVGVHGRAGGDEEEAQQQPPEGHDVRLHLI